MLTVSKIIYYFIYDFFSEEDWNKFIFNELILWNFREDILHKHSDLMYDFSFLYFDLKIRLT